MLIKIYPENPNPRDVEKAAGVLKKGGVIIYPTDTVYGMGCDIFNQKAIERICRLKGIRPEKAQFSFICSDLSHLADFIKPVDTAMFRILKHYLPGPYTFILNASSKVPKLLHSNRKTAGIRVPDNMIIRAIVQELGNPILSTSIHDEDEILEYSTDPELIHEKYADSVDLVIDGGIGGIEPSTIVDCTQGEMEVIRQGKGVFEE